MQLRGISSTCEAWIYARSNILVCVSDLECRLHQVLGMSDPPVMEPIVVRDDGTAPVTAAVLRRSTWEQAEGSALPLGASWIEEEQAFNFAVHAEHAESVTLLLYTPPELVNPSFVYRLDFLRNKSG